MEEREELKIERKVWSKCSQCEEEYAKGEGGNIVMNMNCFHSYCKECIQLLLSPLLGKRINNLNVFATVSSTPKCVQKYFYFKFYQNLVIKSPISIIFDQKSYSFGVNYFEAIFMNKLFGC